MTLIRQQLGLAVDKVESWISLDSAEALFAKAGLKLSELYQRAQTPGFKAVPLPLTDSNKE